MIDKWVSVSVILISVADTEKEMENLANKTKGNNTVLLTTEKDYFRIKENFKKKINFLKVNIEIEDKNKFIEEIKKVI